ncbi:MAG: hypothetical protein WCB68_07840 [Pyrinomonadaceae bacterium]
MKRSLALILTLLLLAQTCTLMAAPSSAVAVKSLQQSQGSVTPLSNREVLEMFKANLASEVIIAKINSSACRFDTSPAALQQLKDVGVPDAVLVAMVTVPVNAPGNQSSDAPEQRKSVALKIPNGTPVDIESAFTVSSQEVKAGDFLSFRVVNPVLINGVTVIAAGATATARVDKSSRGAHFGRAGRLVWTLQDVTAVDGTRIPLQFAGRAVGDSKGAKVATQMIVMGALLWPIAPIVLFHGFKRGENAFIPAGKRFEVFVHGDTTVKAKNSAEY